MKTVTTEIDGLIIIEPAVWSDSRGYFFESFQSERYEKAGIDASFVQDNEAFSSKGVLRGLHYQLPPFAQDKLVRVISGSIIDIAVDIRTDSPTYGKYCSVMLSSENKKQFFVPGGFAHGYICLTDDVIFAYKCSNYYSKDHEGGIRYDDPTIGIDWQFELDAAVISEKDLILPNFGEHRKWPI